ncbi:MAG TPA: hypothetical protein VF713_19030 [Thermoanaerobaculia bacterium]
MAIDTKFESLLEVVKSGSTFESLRAADQLAKLSRRQQKSTDRSHSRVQPADEVIDAEVEGFNEGFNDEELTVAVRRGIYEQSADIKASTAK